MKYINYVCNHENVREYIELNQEVIGYMVQHYPILTDALLSYTKKNIKKFKGKTLKETHENIADFSREATINYIIKCVNKINGSPSPSSEEEEVGAEARPC